MMMIRKPKSRTFTIVLLVVSFVLIHQKRLPVLRTSLPWFLRTTANIDTDSCKVMAEADLNMQERILLSMNNSFEKVVRQPAVPILSDSSDSSLTINRKKYSPWSIALEYGLSKIPLLSPINPCLEKTARPVACNGCMDIEYIYLINNENLCNEDHSSVNTLILIVSAPRNKLEREVLRTTWLTYTKRNTGDIRYVFLFGHSSEDEYVKIENSRTKDIIMGNFKDSYSTMAFKTLMGFKWMDQFCPNTKFVVKTDDDVYINIPGLNRTIDEYKDKFQASIAGYCSFESRPIRQRTSKYFVSEKTYPQRTYPKYCAGNGLVTSKKVISDIVYISKDVPYIYIDDVYIGLCMQVKRYKTLHLNGFDIKFNKTNVCSHKQISAVTIHKCEVNCVKSIWNSQC